MESKKEINQKILELINQYFKISDLNEFIPGVSTIPVTGKVVGVEETINMVQASLDGWLTTGGYNDQFEENLAKIIGVKKLITVNSGSSANLVAFSTLTSPQLGERAIKKGDEVITVAAGFPTTVNPILQFGAIPVFIDINLETLNIDSDLIENAITNKTKAIVLAHALGNPFELKKVKEICNKYNLWLVEDCCDALGSKYDGANVGTYGDISTLSFYPAHHITMGEGGAVFSNNLVLMKIAESFRDWGRDCYCKPGFDNTCNKRYCWKLGGLPQGYDHKYIYSHLGYNLKITDMQAACGVAQLKKLEEFINTRKRNFEYMKKSLSRCEDYLHLPVATKNSEPSWFGFALTLKEESNTSRLDLLEYLNQEKISTRLLFAGNLTKQPYMKNLEYKISGKLENTDRAMNDTFWLGIYPGITFDMIDYMVSKIEKYFGLGF